MLKTPKDHCSRNEYLTRFIFSRGHFRTSDNRVKHQAFEPNKNLETSVFRIDSLDDFSIWQLYTDHVQRNNPRTLYGRADVKADTIYNVNLDIQPNEPPPRHADIVNWPDSKDARMSLAQQIAADSVLLLR